MEAKKLTENCFIMTDTYNNRLGLAFVRQDTVLFTYDLEFYNDLGAIADKFNEKLIMTELPSDEESQKELSGFPIKHDVAVDEETIMIDDEPVIIYKTRLDSKVIFCAGWWTVTTGDITRAVLSPKITTLTSESTGPYKTRFDCQAEVAHINKAKA